jgi:hypothetical protein
MLRRQHRAKAQPSTSLCAEPVALWSNFLPHGAFDQRDVLEFTMNSTAIAGPPARSKMVLIAAGLFALLGSFVAPASAQAGYYGGYYGGGYYGGGYPCSYRCGYPAYRYYHGCYSCGRSLVYERRYVEREYVERRYGYGGYRHYCGYNQYGGCGRYYGGAYYPYGGYGYRRPYGYGGYGYPGVGRRWPVPFYGYEGAAYEEAPRPPAPIGYGDEY